MSLVLNASATEHVIKVHGNWFTFPPGSIKDMNEDKVFHLTSTGAYMGFVPLPDQMADVSFRDSDEGKKIMAEAREQGVGARVRYLEGLKHNELVSLQRDINSKGLKYESGLEMSNGMMKNLQELASYKKSSKAGNEARLKQIEELKKLIED